MAPVSRTTRLVAIAATALVLVTVAGWIGAQQIRSPAQVAADTAAPEPSPITIPVARRSLSAEVIVRGTVRYGAPQAVVLATSRLKQGSDIVTRPPVRRVRLGAGSAAMTVDGRPVFVLPGSIPMHRDVGPGDRGPDVMQLERALARLGASPGAVDGVYDSGTEAAVSAFYLRRGWDPFGATDVQLDQLRTAQAAAAQARDAHLQAINNAQQAARPTRPADVVQARIDANNAREALGAAELRVATAQTKLQTAQNAAAGAGLSEGAAVAVTQRDQAQAAADVAAKQVALAAATEEARQAQVRRFELPVDATLADRQAAEAALTLAQQAAAQAQADLNASMAAANSVNATGAADVQRARNDAAKLAGDVRVAQAELRRAERAQQIARRQARLGARKVGALSRVPDTTALRNIIGSAQREERRTAGEVARIAREAGIQVPANEVLFFPNLPLRVDTVAAKRGSTVAGKVMNVTNSRLAIDSSLSVSDAKLVRPGDRVLIEEQDLGIKTRGRVTRVATTPGTNRVDPNRFYMSVVPNASLPSLVGASVKLTIQVRSTRGRVLAVPVSALSIGGDGRSRIQVSRGGRTKLVPVVPGLAAEGLAEVRPAAGARLAPGDLVVVGFRDGDRALAAGGAKGGP
jgi:peptidoglycan hydrolase-like protein with peptidoglycan-binding domain